MESVSVAAAIAVAAVDLDYCLETIAHSVVLLAESLDLHKPVRMNHLTYSD